MKFTEFNGKNDLKSSNLLVFTEMMTSFPPGNDTSILEGLTIFRTLDSYLTVIKKEFLKHPKA